MRQIFTAIAGIAFVAGCVPDEQVSAPRPVAPVAAPVALAQAAPAPRAPQVAPPASWVRPTSGPLPNFSQGQRVVDCQRRSIGTVVGKWDTMAGPPTARRREVGVDVIFDADRNARRTYSKQALYLLVPANRATLGDFRRGSNTFRYYNCRA